MIIIVTGGCGFIGCALINYLIKSTSYTVVNIDKLTYASNADALKSIENSERYSFHQLDIICYDKLLEIFNQYKPTAIMHLAAESHVDRSISSPSDFIQTNIVGTYTLLEVTRTYLAVQIDIAKSFRFLHVSTDEVFGDLKINGCPFEDSAPLKASSPYSASKASSDLLVHAWGRTYDLPYNITHCSNNYGCWQYPEKLIPFFVNRALNLQSLPVYGDGLQIRDWLHVNDHVEALIAVLANAKNKEVYNIGGNNERSNIEVIKLICSILSELDDETKRQNVDYQTLITHVEDRAGHDRRYAINSGKIKNDLGWQAKIEFDIGLRQTVNWYYNQFYSKAQSGEK